MSRFVIEGGYPLSGTHATPGNKNAALPMIAAALLADGPVTISNLPMIRDVRRMLELVAATGAGVSLDEPARTATIDPRSVSRTSLPEDLCSQIRTSILLAGPLLARHGRAEIPPPGGDVIGRRRLDTHFDGLQALGASIRPGAPYVFDAPHGLRGCPYFLLDEASVTASENLLMAAALAEGETEFFNVACEPHVQDLCRMLAAMGADIAGIGTNRVRVRGVKALHGAAVAVGPDYIESGSYIAAGAAPSRSTRSRPRTSASCAARSTGSASTGSSRAASSSTPAPASEGSGSRATSSARSPSSRTASGPRSPRTCSRSSSSSRRRARGSSSSSRRCSRAASTSSTASSAWARRSCTATRTASS